MEPKIGLALGSGGSRGFAHIGVLKVLVEAGISIDFIAGSSMGALVGVLFGAGYKPHYLEKLAVQFRRKYLLDFTVPKMGFIKGDKAEQLVELLVNQKKMEELSPKVSVIATDLKKGKKVIFEKGNIAQAVRASIAIPGIVVPQRIDNRLFVDGGVIDRVPVSVVKNMGADIIIAVDVSFFNEEPEITSIYDVIMQSMDIMEREMGNSRAIESDIMIKPIATHVKSTQYTNVAEIIRNGEIATKEQLKQLKEKITDWKERQND